MENCVLDPAKREEIELKAKYDFLTVMYKAMWDNVSRHVTVLWQAAGVLGTAFGAALLVKKDSAAGSTGVVLDISSAVVIAAAFWLIAHALDAASWYNRNIQIAGNIEKIFFDLMTPAERVHPYGAPGWRRENKVLLHMRIQFFLGVIVGGAAFLLHLFSRILPDLKPGNSFDPPRTLPAIALIIGIVACARIRKETKADLDDFHTKLEVFRNQPSR